MDAGVIEGPRSADFRDLNIRRSERVNQTGTIGFRDKNQEAAGGLRVEENVLVTFRDLSIPDNVRGKEFAIVLQTSCPMTFRAIIHGPIKNRQAPMVELDA